MFAVFPRCGKRAHRCRYTYWDDSEPSNDERLMRNFEQKLLMALHISGLVNTNTPLRAAEKEAAASGGARGAGGGGGGGAGGGSAGAGRQLMNRSAWAEPGEVGWGMLAFVGGLTIGTSIRIYERSVAHKLMLQQSAMTVPRNNSNNSNNSQQLPATSARTNTSDHSTTQCLTHIKLH